MKTPTRIRKLIRDRASGVMPSQAALWRYRMFVEWKPWALFGRSNRCDTVASLGQRFVPITRVLAVAQLQSTIGFITSWALPDLTDESERVGYIRTRRERATGAVIQYYARYIERQIDRCARDGIRHAERLEIVWDTLVDKVSIRIVSVREGVSRRSVELTKNEVLATALSLSEGFPVVFREFEVVPKIQAVFFRGACFAIDSRQMLNDILGSMPRWGAFSARALIVFKAELRARASRPWIRQRHRRLRTHFREGCRQYALERIRREDEARRRRGEKRLNSLTILKRSTKRLKWAGL